MAGGPGLGTGRRTAGGVCEPAQGRRRQVEKSGQGGPHHHQQVIGFPLSHLSPLTHYALLITDS